MVNGGCVGGVPDGGGRPVELVPLVGHGKLRTHQAPARAPENFKFVPSLAGFPKILKFFKLSSFFLPLLPYCMKLLIVHPFIIGPSLLHFA